MKNITFLLKLEWLKIKNYKPFWILIGMYLALLPLFSLVGKQIKLPEQLGTTRILYMFPNVFDFVGYVGNWLSFFVFSFLAVLTVTNEFSYKTLRQNIISGVSRQDFFLSKLYFLIFISLSATLYYTLVCFVFGVFNTETIFTEKVIERIELVPRFFLMCLGYMSLAFLLSVLLRRTGIAIFLFFSYVMFIEPILRSWILHKTVGDYFKQFAPINVFSDLAPMPLRLFKVIEAGSQGAISFLKNYEAIGASVFYIVLFFGLAYTIIKKRDL